MMFEPNQQPKHLRLLLIILAVVILGALVYYFWPLLGGTPDVFRGEAAGGVTLTLVPSKTTVAPNETFTVNVVMDTGTNEVAAVELHLSYPASLQGMSIQKTAAMTAELVAGAVSPGAASITLGSGTSPVVPGSGIHIATLTLKALQVGSATIDITTDSQIAALNSEGNVLEIRTPTTITVAEPATSPSPAPSVSVSSSPSPAASPSVAPSASPAASPAPTPTPSLTPTPTVVALASPSPSPSPVPTPSPSPSQGVIVAPPPPATLSCSPISQTRIVNETTTISASGGTGSYNWSAPGGNPVSSTGGTMATVFGAPGTYNVSVNSGAQSKSCTVIVQNPSSALACSPSTVNAYIGQPINLNASGATGSVTWAVPGSSPVTTSQHTFTVAFDTPGLHVVTLSNTSQTAQCSITLAAIGQPSPSFLPQVTGPGLVLGTTVRNVTSNSSEADTVHAMPGNTLEFVMRATNNGTSTTRNVRFTDVLPLGLPLVSGSVTVNSVARSDSFVTQNSLLGDVSPGQTTTVRFRVVVASNDAWRVGTTSLTTSATMTSDNVSSQTDTAFVSVVLGSDASGTTPPLNIRKLGRNVTRGQFAESTVVRAFSGDTIEFTLRITSQASTPLNNVLVKDILPAILSYVPGTSKLDGSTVSDAVPAVGGLLIPVIQPGREVVLRLNAKVRQPAPPQSVLNTLRVTSGSSGEIVAQLPVVIDAPSLTAIGDVQTGAIESLLWAFIISAAVTLLYVGYTHTNLFRRREIESLVKDGRQDSDFT